MNDHSMWAHAYQPNSLEECILEAFPEYVQRQLLHVSKKPSLPNFLLYGIAGTGKSTIARVICDSNKYNILRLNGSLVTKSQIGEIEKFITTSTLFGERRVVFIDEADGISPPAQLALRSLIEPTHQASWVLTCNFRKKIIEPIASRFMQIECALPSAPDRERHMSAIVARCRHILESEGVNGIIDNELRAIVSEKYPDIRQTINEVQSRFSWMAEAT